MAAKNISNEQNTYPLKSRLSNLRIKIDQKIHIQQTQTSNDSLDNNQTINSLSYLTTKYRPNRHPCDYLKHYKIILKYKSFQQKNNIIYTIVKIAVIFLLIHNIGFTQAAPSSHKFISSLATSTTIQTFPVSAPLVGNIATAAETLYNSTIPLTTMRQKLAIESNSIQRHVIEVNPMTNEHNRLLKKAFLKNKTITCNDGTSAGFYLRKNPSSKKWIVFLEGGWHCYDSRSCKARWLRLRHLMTSSQWPETRDIGGILSPLPEENPYWHNANHVLVPYCSSDSWSGTRVTPVSAENNFRFMGSLILKAVIAELIPMGLGRNPGSELFLVGSSAGGLGVMLNLDRITDYLLHERNLMVTVRGISDSGWFLDREPYTPSAVASSEAVRQGWKLWQGLLPEDCTKQHPTEPWRCYFGYRLYPSLKSPLFVFQWLFDEAQMRADNVGAPVTPQQWNYIHEMGGALRSSLDNVTAVFAPSCIGHAVLSKRDWVNIKIDDISLPSALRCWEHSTRPRRKRHDKLKRSTEATIYSNSHKHMQRQNQRHKKHQQQNKHKKNNNPDENGKRPRQHLTKEEREERKRRRHENQKRRDERRQRRNRKGNRVLNQADKLGNGTKGHERRHKNRHRNSFSDEQQSHEKRLKQENRRRRRKEQLHQQQKERNQHLKHQQRQQPDRQPPRTDPVTDQDNDMQYQQEQPTVEQNMKKSSLNSNNNADINRKSRVPRVPEKCALRLLERCSWPQCNHSCPTLTNPLTGEEMRFLELLTSFGLDIEAVAAALGVDMHTLNNMDRTELVNLLTQQVS